MKSSVGVRFVTLAIAFGMALVSACAPVAPPPTPTPTAPAAAISTPAPAATPTPTEKPTPSGTITVGLKTPIFHIDPHKRNYASDYSIQGQIHEALVWVDELGNIQPLLATSWERVGDTEWVFHLREGVTFHNGDPFNADAVVFNTERMLSEWGEPRGRHIRVTLDHTEKIDDYTVKLVTKEPNPIFLITVAQFWFVAPSQVKKLGNEGYEQHPMGTGPYKFVEYVKDDHITLEANLDYWGEVPAIKTAIYRIIPEAASRVAGLKAGEIDITEIPVDSFDVVNEDPNLTAVYRTGGRTPWIEFEPDSPLDPDAVALHDVRVRQALNYAVNVEAITENLFLGLTSRMASVVPDSCWGYDPSIEPYAYDPDKARELLAEAGYPELTFTLEVPTIGLMLKGLEVGQTVVNDLEQVGIHATLVPVDMVTLLSERDEGRAHAMYFMPWGHAISDAHHKFYNNLRCDSGMSSMCDAKLDEMIYAEMKEMDPEKRKAIFSEMQQHVHDQAYVVFTYSQPWVYGYNNRVIDWVPRDDEQVLVYACSLAE